ncbi:MAG: tRNA pseudouridine(55) synthase TruB [Sandaracinaceae bacterium]
MARGRASSVHGVLLVDKPVGPTSHDVVAWARRALGTRSVGHAGTLDPLASGVLVLGVGEGTKLLRWLTADDKAYEARIRLGEATDTLDAEGEITDRRDVPELDEATIERAIGALRGPTLQVPPVYSAIKVDGTPLHERARRGEDVVPTAREVVLYRATARLHTERELVAELECGKGYYVRSFARDLAERLGTVGHLTMLRRTRSGFARIEDALDGRTLEGAARGDEAARAEVARALRPLRDGVSTMPRIDLAPADAEDARHGRPIRVTAPEGAGPFALFEDDRLIAIGDVAPSGMRVVRGIRAD